MTFDRHTPRPPHLAIPLPKEPSEFEIQSELYQTLRNYNIIVHGEVTCKSADYTGRGARLDLVVYREYLKDGHGITYCSTYPAAIIEVKRRRTHTEGFRARKTAERASQQYQRYARCGVPVIVCQGMSQIAPTLAQVQEILNHYNPVNPANPVEQKEH